MRVYHEKYVQFIPSDLETVWNFFATPRNLRMITPPDMNFEIQKITGGDAMYAGQLITYKVSPFPFMKVQWITEIKQVVHQQFFVDDQIVGPFALWHHQHFFIEKEDGVEMVDEVSYAIPFGFLGRAVNQLFVKKKIRHIFQFRKEVIEEVFNQIEAVIS